MPDYKVFLSKNFSFAKYIDVWGNIYLSICENNLITDIFKRFIGNQESGILFLNIYMNKMNKLLLYLPLRDEDSIDICIRGAVENLLRFFYCHFKRETIELDKMSQKRYRDLKEDLLSRDFFSNSDKNKEELNNLLIKYGEYSKQVHVEDVIEASEIGYLENIIQNGEMNYLKLNKDILTIINMYEILMGKLFNIKFEELNAAERLRLSNALSRKRYEGIINRLP